jgi:Tol biopolymer transport system component
LGQRLLAPLILAVAMGGTGCSSDDPTGPSPSPPHLAGPHIAFASNRSGSIGIHLYGLATGHIVRLSPTGAFEQDPALSPDGNRIAFTHFHPEGRFILATMAVDGTSRAGCTDDPKVTDAGPHWSPDSRRLAFTRTNRTSAVHDVYTALANGDSLERVTWNGHSTALDWSPDGTRLLFVQDSTSSGARLVEVKTFEFGVSRTTTIIGLRAWSVIAADYSPDGGHIAYSCEGLSATPRLAISNADGTGLTALGTETDFAAGDGLGRVSWSPDGASIVFSGHLAGETDDVYTVYVPDGSEPVPLLTGPPWEYSADWGPKP